MLPDIAADLLPDLANPEACLKRAAKCEEMANRRTVGKEQAMLMSLAAHWREMADELKTFEKK